MFHKTATDNEKADMPSAMNFEVAEFPSASASGGSGGDFRRGIGGSFAGESAKGQPMDAVVNPPPPHTLYPKRTVNQSAETEVRSILADLPPLPVDVAHWIVQTGVDSTDESAVWVWAVLTDDTADIDKRIAIRDMVFDFIRERSEVPIWVYVSFKSKAEMDE